MKKYRILYSASHVEGELLSQPYRDNEILFEGIAEDPFEELLKFKRKRFSDVSDHEFRSSGLASHLKRIWNHGGKITLEIMSNKTE